MLNSQIQGGVMNIAGQELKMVDGFLVYPGINKKSTTYSSDISLTEH